MITGWVGREKSTKNLPTMTLIEIVAKTVAAHFIMRVGRTELAPADFTSARVGNRLKCVDRQGYKGLDL